MEEIANDNLMLHTLKDIMHSKTKDQPVTFLSVGESVLEGKVHGSSMSDCYDIAMQLTSKFYEAEKVEVRLFECKTTSFSVSTFGKVSEPTFTASFIGRKISYE